MHYCNKHLINLMKCFPDHKQRSYKTRQLLLIRIITIFLKGFQIFGRFYVMWQRVPYLRPKTSEAFSTIINWIHYRNI